VKWLRWNFKCFITVSIGSNLFGMHFNLLERLSI
jgi:hypothetical protein